MKSISLNTFPTNRCAKAYPFCEIFNSEKIGYIIPKQKFFARWKNPSIFYSQALCDLYKIDANKISCEFFSFNAKSKVNLGKAPTLDTLLKFEAEKLKALKGPTQRRPLDPIEGSLLFL